MADESNKKFIERFMQDNISYINSVVKRYQIPNRYSIDDIKGYIIERILHILESRSSKGTEDQILDKDKYFRRCIEYYCVEYQRMHGYIFCLPKRPRKNCELDEMDAKSKGFKYLYDITSKEEASLLFSEPKFENKVDDEKNFTSVWNSLTGILTENESKVIECVYSRGMTWSQTAQHLGVPQSTCWFRKKKALNAIQKYVHSYTGELGIKDVLRNIIRDAI